jgi:hypothetical protein
MPVLIKIRLTKKTGKGQTLLPELQGQRRLIPLDTRMSYVLFALATIVIGALLGLVRKLVY